MSPITVLVVFAFVIAGGLALAGIRARGKNPPSSLAIGHGLLAAVGLVLLIAVQSREYVGGNFLLAIPFLAIAALVGLSLFAAHRRGKLIPGKVIVLHATLAVLGFLIVLTGVLRSGA